MARVRRQSAKAERTGGRKMSLMLSAEVDFLLSTSAKLRGVNRSARAEALLSQALKEDKILAPYRAAFLAESGESETAA